MSGRDCASTPKGRSDAHAVTAAADARKPRLFMGLVAKVNATLIEGLSAPKVKEILATSGAEAAATSPEALARFLQNEMAKWGKVVKAAGIKGD